MNVKAHLPEPYPRDIASRTSADMVNRDHDLPAPAAAPSPAPAEKGTVRFEKSPPAEPEESMPRTESTLVGSLARTLPEVVVKSVAPIAEAATARQRRATEAVQAEMSALKGELEDHLEFQFMHANTQLLQGLQDWPTASWEEYISDNPRLAQTLAKMIEVNEFGGTGPPVQPASASLGGIAIEPAPEPADPKELAGKVKALFKGPLPISEWRTLLAFQNACINQAHTIDEDATSFYISPAVLSNALFLRDFPLGVDSRVAGEARYKFAIKNSGLFDVRHRESKKVTYTILVGLIFLGVFVVIYLLMYTVGNPDVWTMTETMQNVRARDYTKNVNTRTKERGRVASIIQSLTFSALVNASLDKLGKIDPSTSTVMIGMFLGNTFGFILDTMLASDEGLREYLWNPAGGMRYAMGSLATERFMRFFVTVIFDMFFTVILFKHFYSKLVQVAGFSQNGREWMANFVVSAVLGVLTFVVYANMTRFEWAYPSGLEDVSEQWISGPTMLLAVIIMNMVYLTSETRVRIEEPGINDPGVKLIMTMINFVILYLLQENDILDPSEPRGRQNVTADWRDVNLPLKGVCEAQSQYVLGVLIFVCISLISLGAVIFGTSQQTLSGVKKELSCKPDDPEIPSPSKLRRQMTIKIKAPKKTDARNGKLCLFASYNMAIFILMLFFSFTPLVAHDGPSRNETGWRSACDNNDVEVLDMWGLS